MSALIYEGRLTEALGSNLTPAGQHQRTLVCSRGSRTHTSAAWDAEKKFSNSHDPEARPRTEKRPDSIIFQSLTLAGPVFAIVLTNDHRSHP